METRELTLAAEAEKPVRLDAGLAAACPDISRARFQALIREGQVSIYGAPVSDPSRKVAPGTSVTVIIPPPAPAEGPVFLGKVMLEPEQARTFNAIVERRELKRAEAAREAVLLWIEKHQEALVGV